MLWRCILILYVGLYCMILLYEWKCTCTNVHTELLTTLCMYPCISECLCVLYSPWLRWLWPGSPGAVLLWSWPAGVPEDGSICICPVNSDPWCSPYTRWQCSHWSLSWCCQPGVQICSLSHRESSYHAGTRDTPDTHYDMLQQTWGR